MQGKSSPFLNVTVIYAVSVSLAIMALVTVNRFLAEEGMDNLLKRQIRGIKTSFTRAMEDKAASLKNTLELVQLDPTLGTLFRGACRNGERNVPVSLFRRINQLAINTEIDSLEAFSADMRLIQRAGSAGPCGYAMDIWGLEDSLAGDNVLVLNTEDEGLMLRAMGPVREQGEIVGAISFGTRIDEGFLRRAADLDKGELFLSSGTAVVGTVQRVNNGSHRTLDQPTLEAAADVVDGILGPPVLLRGTLHKTYYFPIRIADVSVLAVAAIDTTDADATMTALTRGAVAWGLVVLGLATTAFLLFRRRIGEHLGTLGQALEQVWRGAPVDPLPETADHEFAMVARAFNGMARSVGASMDHIRGAKERAELLLKLSPNAIFTVDLDRRITSWNNKAEEITGYTEAEMLGTRCMIFADEPCRDSCGLLDSSIPKPIMGKDCFIRRKDGEQRTISKNVDVLRDATGNPVGGIETFLDVTAQRKAEEGLRAAKQRAEEASRAKTAFLANVSHEVRTPMSGILGMAELLTTTPLSREQAEYLSMMRSSADSLHRLLDDILDYSTFEAGGLTLRKAPFNIRTLMDSTVNYFRAASVERSISLGWAVQPDVPDILLGDEGRLSQVLINLIGNAMKFTEAGSVDLRVVRRGGTGGRISLEFSVKDTGIGIPPDQQSRIFDAFAQGDGFPTRTYPGTGLGLSICKRLVQAMKGDIWVSSIPGEGSDFRFSAVFDTAENGAEPTKSIENSRIVPAVEGARALTPLRVLLVEDNEINQALAVRILNHRGHATVLAQSGAEALETLGRDSFDVILMDIQMPGMDGIETTRRIREMERATGARTPVIAMTAHAMGNDRQRCLAAGMDDYISKPFHAEDLYQRLEQWTGTAQKKMTAPGGNPSERAPAPQTKPTASDVDTIDSAEALARLDGDGMMYRKILRIFLTDGRHRMNSLAEALRESDLGRSEREAHSLKTMAATVGARHLADLAGRAEEAAHASDNGAVSELYPMLDSAFEAASRAAETLEGTMASPSD